MSKSHVLACTQHDDKAFRFNGYVTVAFLRAGIILFENPRVLVYCSYSDMDLSLFPGFFVFLIHAV
jgi:hypothetical protein